MYVTDTERPESKGVAGNHIKKGVLVKIRPVFFS